jgi:hypothetical protein
LTATQFSCGAGAFAPDGAWQSLFLGATASGTYLAFNAIANRSAPAAPNELTITDLPEPATPALFAGGLAFLTALDLARRRRCRQQSTS